MLVSALQDSTDLMRQLNQNLAVGDRRCWPTTPTKSASGRRTSTPPSATCRASSPTTARRSAPRRTSWRRSPRRWPTASTTSSRLLHVAPDDVAELHQHLRAGPGRADRRAGDQQLRQPDLVPVRRDPGRVAAGCRASRRSCACSTWRRSSRTASTTSRRWARTSSSARRPGPTRSPTARTGCARITFRRNRLRRPPPAGAAPPPRRQRAAAPDGRRRPAGAADRPGRRTARNDGAARRWLMMMRRQRAAIVAGGRWSSRWRRVRLRRGEG